MTGHPAHLDYISTPGTGLWQDTSQQASWMESTDHCTSPWFKLDTSTVHFSKLIMGCYVNLMWSPPPHLACLGYMSSHTKNLMMKAGPVSETQIDLNNLMWMSAWVDFTGHIYHATEIIDYLPSTCIKRWTAFGEIHMHISANLCTVNFKQCVMKVLWKLTWKGIVLCIIYLSYTLSNYYLLLCVHNWWSYIICTSTYVFLFVTDVKVKCHFLLHVNAINTPNHLCVLKGNIILIVLLHKIHTY